MPPRRSRRLTTAPLPISSPSTSSAPDVSKKRLVSIDCLPDAVLLHVLASIKPVDTTYARESLPLVCKRWKHLLQSPSAIWEEVELDFCSKSAPHQRILRTAVEKWLVPKGPYVQRLHLRNSSADTTHSFSRDGASLNNILMAVSDSLTSLIVTNCNDIFVGPAFEQLSTLSLLSKLHVTAVRTRFNPDSFRSLSGLKHLKDIKIAADNDFETVLHSDVLSQIPDSLLNLTAITSLSLSSKGITEVPMGVTALACLERMSLDGCRNLKRLPSCFHNLKSLKELSLNDTTGTVLMDSIKHLKLEKLSLRRAGVNRMALGLENCSINHLDASENPFLSKAEVFTAYQALSLQVLNLNNCELDIIPDAVSRLTSLKVLELANNGLMDIPDALSKLTNLECLNLEGNCFPKLPEVLPKMKSLCCLSLVACNYLEVHYNEVAPIAKWSKLSAMWLWKTDSVKYQNYSQDALQQLKAKLQRKRRPIDLWFENNDEQHRKGPWVMRGLTTSMMLSLTDNTRQTV